MIYGSVCSGIEAATVAWHPLGWQPAFYSEVAGFPRTVLAHHYPGVPLHGDFTTITETDYAPINLLVGGTPCQAFSVAGLRQGFSDDRGNLSREFVRLAGRLRPRWVVWENVPGVLSIDGGRAFASLLGGLAECGYGTAYRVLDAQYFGVAQRRRRVFVVGYLGDWRTPAAVLFEPNGLHRDPPPRHRPETAVAALTARGVGTCGADDNQAQAGHILALGVAIRGRDGGATAELTGEVATALRTGSGGSSRGHILAFGGGNTGGPLSVAACLTARGQRLDFEVETFAVHGSQPIPLLEAGARTGISTTDPRTGISTTDPRAGIGVGQSGDPMYTLQAGKQHAVCVTGPVTHALMRQGADASEDGTGRGTPIITAPDQAGRVRRLTPRECERLQGFPDGYTLIPGRSWRRIEADDAAYLAAQGATVRQTAEGGWTTNATADAPRYAALGNSMAVPVMRWIGRRIEAIDTILRETAL